MTMTGTSGRATAYARGIPYGPVDDRVSKKTSASYSPREGMRHDALDASRLRPAAFHPLCRIASAAAHPEIKARALANQSAGPVSKANCQIRVNVSDF